MEGQEDQLRSATVEAWSNFKSGRSPGGAVHPECSVALVEPDDTPVFGDWKTVAWPDELLQSEIMVQHVKILPVGKQSSASVQAKVGTKYIGFLVFLQEAEEEMIIWKCISVAMGNILSERILPGSYEKINALTWDGYCEANRLCDGELMSKYFHQTCRLTYTGPDNKINICRSEAFFAKVSGRYENEAPHQPYQHLKNDPRLKDFNTLISIEFASPQLAMVTLKVGHPPFLWTDLLTCMRLNESDDSQWWIVHKSSDNEPHPLN